METSIFERLWEDNSSQNLLKTKNFWDSFAEDFNNSVMKEEKRKESLDVIEFLILKNAINKNDNILDIGCGPGKYSIELAKVAKGVTGIDISSNMIKHAKGNVKKEGLNNVDFKLIPWQDVDINEIGWNNNFDLVFASMTPAINSKKTLLKMIESSKGYCFMSSFVNSSCKIKEELSEKLFGQGYKNKKKYEDGIYCAFNILWNMGFYPEIIYKDVVWEKERTLEKATEVFTMQFSNSNINFPKDELKKEINKNLSRVSENGKVKYVIRSKIAWLVWKV